MSSIPSIEDRVSALEESVEGLLSTVLTIMQMIGDNTPVMMQRIAEVRDEIEIIKGHR